MILNNKDKTLKYTGAGDLPLIYKNAQTGEVKSIKSQCMLLGFASEGNYKDTTINLHQGDSIFLVTDGIMESRNDEGIQFGSGSLTKAIKNGTADKDVTDYIREEFSKYTLGKFEDDVSLITIKVL